MKLRIPNQLEVSVMGILFTLHNLAMLIIISGAETNVVKIVCATHGFVFGLGIGLVLITSKEQTRRERHVKEN